MRYFIRAFVILTIVPVLALATASDTMAPLSSYVMGHHDEIALARSAAPRSILGPATVLVLTAHGYVTAADGTNGFTCLVARAWDQPFDMKPFWGPTMRAPMCLNSQATRTILPYMLERTKLALGGGLRWSG